MLNLKITRNLICIILRRSKWLCLGVLLLFPQQLLLLFINLILFPSLYTPAIILLLHNSSSIRPIKGFSPSPTHTNFLELVQVVYFLEQSFLFNKLIPFHLLILRFGCRQAHLYGHFDRFNFEISRWSCGLSFTVRKLSRLDRDQGGQRSM